MIEWTVDVKYGKYLTWYNQLIDRAKSRSFPKHEYSEKHHIIPRSLGGSNKKDNIVKLSAREHYIAHLLLYKFQADPKNKGKMAFALVYMAHGSNFPKRLKRTYKVNSKIYEAAKRASAEALKNRTVSEITKQKIREANARTKDLRSEKLSGTNNPMYGKQHSEEMKQQIAETMRKYWDDEKREKKSQQIKSLWQNEEWKKKILEERKNSEGWINRDWKGAAKKSIEGRIRNGTNKRTKEQRQKLSEIRRALYAAGKIVPWNKGKHTKVFRTKESLQQSALKAAKTRKINGTQVSMKGEENPFYGKKHKPESIEKYRATMAAKKAAGWKLPKREVNWEAIEKAKATKKAKKLQGYVAKRPVFTDEEKRAIAAKISATKAAKRAAGYVSPLKGKPKSPEHKASIIAARRNRILNPK